MAIQLRTAEEMYGFCTSCGLGSGNMKSWDLKHFGLIEDMLDTNEHVFTAFEGLHNFKSMTQHDKNFAYVITSKRIIMAQKRAIGSVVQTVSLNNINDITFQKKLVMGIITVDTIKETFNVAADYETASRIHKSIQSALDMARKSGYYKH